MIKILVVSRDAGGANILASLIKKYRHTFNWITCVSGPAKKIFLKEKINSYAIAIHLKDTDFDSILKSLKPNLVLTGTGWGSDFEINFIKTAKKNKIKTASFLDHWSDYRQRFGYPGNWTINLPDFIFVGDEWAYGVALRNKFPKNILIQVENPYIEEFIEQAQRIKRQNDFDKNNKKKILYMSAPVYGHALRCHNDPYHWGFTEYEVIKDLLNIMKSEERGTLLELKISLHPAEKINKYSKLLKNKNYMGIRKVISVSNPASNPFIKDCIWADLIIGCDSTMALVIASKFGKKTVSYSPNAKRPCTLPQKEIKKIYSIEGLAKQIKVLKTNQNAIRRKKERKVKRDLFAKAISKIIG